MNVGEAIKLLRHRKNIKQKDFCKLVGITQSYLSLIEKGHRTPTLQVLENIAKECQQPLPILFWFMVDESDVPEEKKEAYRILKPTVDEMINTIW